METSTGTTPAPTSYFAGQLKSRREARDLSQQDLAEIVQQEYARRKGLDLTGADPTPLKPTRFDIIRWEKGQAPRDQLMLAALAQVLGCEVDELLRPEHALTARDKAVLHDALEPLVDVLYDLIRERFTAEAAG